LDALGQADTIIVPGLADPARPWRDSTRGRMPSNRDPDQESEAMGNTNKTTRTVLRWTHLLVGFLIGVFVYTPARDN
jgi:hypothetical protein